MVSATTSRTWCPVGLRGRGWRESPPECGPAGVPACSGYEAWSLPASSPRCWPARTRWEIAICVTARGQRAVSGVDVLFCRTQVGQPPPSPGSPRGGRSRRGRARGGGGRCRGLPGAQRCGVRRSRGGDVHRLSATGVVSGRFRPPHEPGPRPAPPHPSGGGQRGARSGRCVVVARYPAPLPPSTAARSGLRRLAPPPALRTARRRMGAGAIRADGTWPESTRSSTGSSPSGPPLSTSTCSGPPVTALPVESAEPPSMPNGRRRSPARLSKICGHGGAAGRPTTISIPPTWSGSSGQARTAPERGAIDRDELSLPPGDHRSGA